MNMMLQIRSNGQITLPASVRRQARLKEGDLLEVTVAENGTICLAPRVAIERDQAYFYTERWQAGEREAEADLKAGRYEDFDNMDDFLKSLEG
jgi:AbrB family looped-hinge helix DNA binding protein